MESRPLLSSTMVVLQEAGGSSVIFSSPGSSVPQHCPGPRNLLVTKPRIWELNLQPHTGRQVERHTHAHAHAHTQLAMCVVTWHCQNGSKMCCFVMLIDDMKECDLVTRNQPLSFWHPSYKRSWLLVTMMSRQYILVTGNHAVPSWRNIECWLTTSGQTLYQYDIIVTGNQWFWLGMMSPWKSLVTVAAGWVCGGPPTSWW